MCSRSSNSGPENLVPVGRVRGHRGVGGELTVDTFSQDASLWSSMGRLWLWNPKAAEGGFHEVERCRAYRNRLALKLVDIDDANIAAGMRGWQVFAEPDDSVKLPEGVHFADRLIGLVVADEAGKIVGRVAGVLATGGTDVLRVVPETAESAGGEDDEILIPMAREIAIAIDEEAGRITVRLPEGLVDMNRSGS